MRIYWRGTAIPELEGLPPDQQERIWHAVTRQSGWLPQFWAAGGVWLLMLLVAFRLPQALDLFPAAPNLDLLWAIGWSWCGVLLASQIFIHALRPVVAAYRQTVDSAHVGESDSDDFPPDSDA